MHYIRFLKTPKVHVENAAITLRAVITITTDLGETFHPSNLDLLANLRSSNSDGEIYLQESVRWTSGSRSSSITIHLTRSQVKWPACLHVAAKHDSRNDQHVDAFLPPVVDVWSGELNPTKGLFDAGHRVERRFTALNERQLCLLEDAGDSIARHLWDGSQALAQFIDETISETTPTALPLLEYVLVSATYRRLNVLELGCGCGTVGISLAQSIPDCNVMLTDLPEAQPLANANIKRMNPAIKSKVAFEPLDWEVVAATSTLPRNIAQRAHDLIIVSECTYNSETLEPLVKTLAALVAARPKATIVVSTKTRHDSEARFFELMMQQGFVLDSSVRVPLPGIPGDGYADSATEVGLYVYHGKTQRLSLSPRDENGRSASDSRAGSR